MIPMPSPRPSPVDRHLHRTIRTLPHRGGYLGFLALMEGRPPGIEELRDAVADAVARVPAWNYRVCSDSRRVWEPARGQDPRGHVHELPVPEGAVTPEELARAVHDMPFPEHADNWGVWLLTGWAPDRYALACRVHHALQDGRGAMAGICAFMVPDLELPLSVPPDAEPPFRPIGVARWATRTLPSLLRPTARWTPARQEAGTTRTLHVTGCDTERLRELARAAEATVNQVYLAVTAGALRAWTPQDWTGRGKGPLHAFVPVECRPAGHETATLGNHLVALRAELHCGEPDPRRRLDLMRASTDKHSAQAPHQRAALRVLPRVADLTTRCLLLRSRTALLTSNVPLGAGLVINGDPVRQIVCLPPLVFGHPLTVVLTTYEGQATVYFTSDRRDPDPGRLPQLWQTALAELEEAYAPV